MDKGAVWGYAVDPERISRCNLAGVRAPQAPFEQARRCRHDWIIFMVLRGEIELVDEMPGGEETTVVRAGTAHLVAPGVWQRSARPFPAGIVFYWIHFECDDPPCSMDLESARAVARAEQCGGAQGPRKRWLLPREVALGERLKEMAAIHERIVALVGRWGLADRAVQALATSFLHELHQKACEEAAGSAGAEHAGDARQVARAQHLIEERIGVRGFGCHSLAQELNVHPNHLNRCFRRVLGTTLGEYIQGRRLERARSLLAQPEPSIKEAAILSGFSSGNYFGRIFARAYGCSPGKYRERLWSDISKK